MMSLRKEDHGDAHEGERIHADLDDRDAEGAGVVLVQV
jgi:hypothetical protein